MAGRAQQERVYFIRTLGEPAVVKVGCSTSPISRLSQLSAWSPYKLELVATTPGGTSIERGFHRLLHASHSHFEWFSLTSRVRTVMAEVAAEVFDFSTLPMTGPTPHQRPPRESWGPVQHLSMSMSQQLGHLRRQTGAYEPKVWNAASRFNCGRYSPDFRNRGNLADVELVREYLRQHGRDLNAKALSALTELQPARAA